MEPEVKKAPVRFYEIDLLRFLAALSVLLYHYTYRGYGAEDYSPIPFVEIGQFTRYGYLGVELFFIISGYVVLLSAQGKTVRQFLLSRVTRLYPAFWVACTLTFIIERIWGTKAADVHMAPALQAGLTQYAYNMTMLHDFFGVAAVDGAYWSLTVEITFYFLISLLIAYKLMQHIDLFILFWLLYAAVVGPYAPSYVPTSPFTYLLFPRFAPYFATGMLFYLMQHPANRTILRYVLLAGAYLLAMRSGIGRAAEQCAIFHVETSWKVSLVILTSFFCTFYLVAFRKIDFSKQRWLSWLGVLTYPLYLLHENIGFIAFHRLGTPLNKYVVLSCLLIIMLLGAYLIHILIEKKTGKLLGKHINNMLDNIQNPTS